MIEVAISSMEEALTADGNPIPAGSTIFERDPLVLPSRDKERAPAAEPVAAAATDEPPAVP